MASRLKGMRVSLPSGEYENHELGDGFAGRVQVDGVGALHMNAWVFGDGSPSTDIVYAPGSWSKAEVCYG